MTKSQIEALLKQIEEERKKLNELVGDPDKREDAYRQSLVVDRLMEQYLEESFHCTPV